MCQGSRAGQGIRPPMAGFAYDAGGRLSGETDPFTAYGQGLGYDADGRLTDVWYGWQGDHRALGYDGLGRVTADTREVD